MALDKETCQVEFVKTANQGGFVVSQVINPIWAVINDIRLLTSEINHELRSRHRLRSAE